MLQIVPGRRRLPPPPPHFLKRSQTRQTPFLLTSTIPHQQSGLSVIPKECYLMGSTISLQLSINIEEFDGDGAEQYPLKFSSNWETIVNVEFSVSNDPQERALPQELMDHWIFQVGS